MENLVISILGIDEPRINQEILKLVTISTCNIIDCRLFLMGPEASINLYLSGVWSALAKFEAGFSVLEKKYQFRAIIYRTKTRPSQPECLPYSSYIVAPNRPGALQKIIEFLLKHNINTHDLHVTSYIAPVTTADMLGISLAFSLPISRLVADFREYFIIFCDENNFDVVMEPQRN